MNKRYTSRSAQITKQRCPRQGYLSNFFPNAQGKAHGLGKRALPFQMLTGIYVHEGVALLLTDLKNGVKPDLNKALTASLSKYVSEINEENLQTYGCDFLQVQKEQMMLIEGMLIGWFYKRLPYFKEEFEIIEVEVDRSFLLVNNPDIDEDVIMEFKPDAVMRHKETGLIYVLSNKTTGNMDDRKLRDAKSDIQGLSEIYGVEKTMGLKVHGIIMEYFLTGRKEIEEVNGVKKWVQWSPLFRGWYNALNDEYAWRFTWEKLEGGQGRLGKGWTRFDASMLSGGVEEWLDIMYNGKMFPVFGKYSDPISTQFLSIEYYRNSEDIDEWVESIQQQEIETGNALEIVNNIDNEKDYVKNLRKYFPMYRHSCNYPVKCQFFEICHETAGADPLMNGYVYRTPHHKMQFEELE